jgi:hypothetical protein
MRCYPQWSNGTTRRPRKMCTKGILGMRIVHHGEKNNKQNESANAKPSTWQVDQEISDPKRNMDRPTIRRNRLDQLWHCIQAHGKEKTNGNHKALSQPMAYKYETQSILWRNQRLLHVRQYTRGLETRHIVQGTRRGAKQGRLLVTGQESDDHMEAASWLMDSRAEASAASNDDAQARAYHQHHPPRRRLARKKSTKSCHAFLEAANLSRNLRPLNSTEQNWRTNILCQQS